jgi:hypothetical protein
MTAPDTDTSTEAVPTVRERLAALSPERIELHWSAGRIRVESEETPGAVVPVADLDQPAPRHLAIVIFGS